MRTYGVPYYLKIDIEGADMLCLEGLLPFQGRSNFVSFESDRRSMPALRAEIGLLKRLRYTKFQLVDQNRVCEQTEPFPAREGTYSNSRIVYGSHLAKKHHSKSHRVAHYSGRRISKRCALMD
jgi:hypothetical protein